MSHATTSADQTKPKKRIGLGSTAFAPIRRTGSTMLAFTKVTAAITVAIFNIAHHKIEVLHRSVKSYISFTQLATVGELHRHAIASYALNAYYFLEK